MTVVYSPNSLWFSKRLLVAVVVFLLNANAIMLMNNMNIAVVEMTSNKTITIAGYEGPNTTIIRRAEFDWDSITTSSISNAYTYGSLFACFGGYFAHQFGGSVSSAVSLIIAGILTTFHPVILSMDYRLFLVCRFVTGFFANLFSVCVAEIYSRWFPRNERSILTAIGCNGINAGVAISYPLFGYIATEWAWQAIFHVSGMISLAISLVCLIVVKNRPSQDRYISDEELSYILHETDEALRTDHVRMEPHPYKKILLSGPVFALCIAKFTLLWETTVLSWNLPQYIKDLTGKSTEEIGVISSIPTAVQLFTFPIAGVILDIWANTENIGLTRMHKLTVCSAFFTSSLCLLIVVFANDFTTSLIFLILVQIIMSVAPPVFEPITVNISPNDSCVIAGLCKFVASLGNIASRTIIGRMIFHHSSQEWNDCFLLTACIFILGMVIFMIFASSEVQPWSSSSTFQQERFPLLQIKYKKKTSKL